MSKIIELPLQPYLIKFAEKEFDWDDGVLILTRKRLMRPASLNPDVYRQYFMYTSIGYPRILCKTVDTRLYKLYYFVHYLQSRFFEKMCDRIECRVRAQGQNQKQALFEFLAEYDITESEYAWESAYRLWQRSNQYRRLKEDSRTRKLVPDLVNHVINSVEKGRGVFESIEDFMKLHKIQSRKPYAMYRWLQKNPRYREFMQLKQQTNELDKQVA